MTFEELLEKYQVKTLCASGCGDGWVPFIEEAFIKLIALGWDRKVAQIKEKFGHLRFYIDPQPDVDYEKFIHIADEAECKSYKICEVCGAPGETCSASGSWLNTMCKPCWEDRVDFLKKRNQNFKDYSWYRKQKEIEE